MSHTNRQKTNIFWALITLILYIFRETTKSNVDETLLKRHKTTGHKLLIIENKGDLKELYNGKWVVIVDYKRRKKHFELVKCLITKINIAVLYIDTLEKASIANKYNFTTKKKVCLFDKNKYFERIKKEFEEELEKICRVFIKTHQSNYIQQLSNRLTSRKLSKYDKLYHLENIDLFIRYRLRFLNNIIRKFINRGGSSIFLFSSVCSNIVNSLVNILK